MKTGDITFQTSVLIENRIISSVFLLIIFENQMQTNLIH